MCLYFYWIELDQHCPAANPKSKYIYVKWPMRPLSFNLFTAAEYMHKHFLPNLITEAQWKKGPMFF